MPDTIESISVLHVDDEPDLAELTADMLVREDDRFEVETANSPTDGLELLARREFDCVVSDYDMPATTGIEFLEAVREDYPDLPFILYTGKGSEEVASDAISAGVTDYLQKQSGMDHYKLLANRVVNAVEQYRMEQSVARTRQRFQTLVKEATDTILIVDSDATITFATPSAESILGRTPDELVGSNGFDPIHPEDQERVMETFASLAKNPGERRTVEFRYQRPDGSWIWAEARGRNLLDEPVIDGIVVYTRDITERKERELGLEAIRDRIDFALDATDSIIFEVDLETRHETRHGPFDRLYGIESEEISTTQDFYDACVHPADRDRHERLQRPEAFDSGETIEFEFRTHPDQGEVRWMSTEMRLDTDSEGDPQRLIGLNTDITERKEREQDLEAMHDRVEFALDATDSIIYEVDLDTWEETNHGPYERLFGFDPTSLNTTEEMISKVVHPDDQDRVKHLHRIDTLQEQNWRIDYEFRTHPDRGDVCWLHSKAYTQFAADGTPEKLVGLSTDVTEHKEREKEFRQTAARLEALFDGSPDLINVHDTDGNILDPNPQLCEETGYDATELTDMKVWDLDQAIDPDEAATLWENMDVGDRQRVEGVYQRKDGTTFPVEVHIRRLHLDDEDQFIAIARNITDRKQREQTLERQNERLEKVATVISHDLRNPLNVVQGRLELAGEDCDSEHLDEAANAVDRSLALIDDVLTLAREGDRVSDVESVALAEITEDCWQTVETAEATLVTDTAQIIRADRSQLQQLLENLIGNAVEHAGDDVTITVAALEDASGFYVEDDGPGISEAERDDVFEVGYSTRTGGTGFGLSIVNQVADTHGWDVRLTESTEGGARFEITGVEFAE